MFDYNVAENGRLIILFAFLSFFYSGSCRFCYHVKLFFFRRCCWPSFWRNWKVWSISSLKRITLRTGKKRKFSKQLQHETVKTTKTNEKAKSGKASVRKRMFSVTDAEVEWTKIERIVSYLRSHGFGILLFISLRNNDFFPLKQWNANNDAIETGFDAFAFYRQRGNNFSLVPSFVRCVIISKCCQNMPIIPTSLLLPPTAPGSPSSPTHLALSQHLSCHRYHRNRWRFSFFFFGIISGTCRYIRFSFQNQCIASFGASFYNIIVKLYASSQQKKFRGKNRARKRERQTEKMTWKK